MTRFKHINIDGWFHRNLGGQDVEAFLFQLDDVVHDVDQTSLFKILLERALGSFDGLNQFALVDGLGNVLESLESFLEQSSRLDEHRFNRNDTLEPTGINKSDCAETPRIQMVL